MRKKKQAIETDDVELAQLLGLVRVVLGVGLFFAPRLSGRLWTGVEPRDVSGNLAMRGMGARDVAIGLGILMSLERGTSVRGWLEASALSDSADAFGTLTHWGELGTPRALTALAAELGAAWLGTRLAQALD